jgi:hypothetical protein
MSTHDDVIAGAGVPDVEIGRPSPQYRLNIDAGDLVRFARAAGYVHASFIGPNAPGADPETEIVASPTFLIVMRGDEHAALKAIGVDMVHRQGVDGGSEWTYHLPIRQGDVITATASVARFDTKSTSVGESLFQLVDIEYRNQFGDLVVTQRDTRIYF